MIIRLPKKQLAGTLRNDLIEHIDVAACSLKLAGIKIPEHIQGHDFLSSDYKPRRLVFAARDRCDETVDILRCVRDSRYKYIRNFMSHLPHTQPSQYKDGKKIVQVIRSLYSEGKLNEQQSLFLLTAVHRKSSMTYRVIRMKWSTLPWILNIASVWFLCERFSISE